MSKGRLAACGIQCSACASYKVTMDQDLKAAKQLVGWYRGQGWIGKEEGAQAVIRKSSVVQGLLELN